LKLSFIFSFGDGIICGNDGEEPQRKSKHSTDPKERLPPPFLVLVDDDKPANPTRQSASAASVDNTNQPSFSAVRGGPSGSQSRSRWPSILSSPAATFVRPTPANKPGASLEKQMIAYMDPAARQEQIEANGITQFYADQLHDTSK
jgi:hypothetical protein